MLMITYILKKIISGLIILSLLIANIEISYANPDKRASIIHARTGLSAALRPQAVKSRVIEFKQSSAGLYKADIERLNRNMQAACFLRKKGAIVPEIIEILGEPHMHSDINNFPSYLKEEILRQEKDGVQFLIARMSGGLATSFRGKQTFLSDILFNAEKPAPHGLLYMYIRHEAFRHSGVSTEVKAVMREISAWNSLPDEEKANVRDWADWYVDRLIRLGKDTDTNIIKDSFYNIAGIIDEHPNDISQVERYVNSKYGEIHLRKKHDKQKVIHYAGAITVFSACLVPVFAGYLSIFSAGMGFLFIAALYYAGFRYTASIRIKHIADDVSVADDFKGIRSGSPDESNIYYRNLMKVVNAYKSAPYKNYPVERKKAVKKHFLIHLVQPEIFGEKTDPELAPPGTMIKSAIRSNTSASVLVEHLLESSMENFSEPAWVALIEESSLNQKFWFEKVISIMDIAVVHPFCTDMLINLLFKAQGDELLHYEIQDIDKFRTTLHDIIVELRKRNRHFKCRSILNLCNRVRQGKAEEVIFAMGLLRDMKFHVVEGAFFNPFSVDIISQNMQEIIEQNGRVNLVIGGGETITHPYHIGSIKMPSVAEQLAQRSQAFDWNKHVKAWLLSEVVGLSPESINSIGYALNKSLFSKVFENPAENTRFIEQRLDPEGYITSQKQAGGIDLIIGGVGPDGHFGWNFPGATADPAGAGKLLRVKLPSGILESTHGEFMQSQGDVFGWTMGLADIIQPHEEKKPKVIILVLGNKKSRALQESLQKPDSPLAKIIHELDATIIATDQVIAGVVPDYLERISDAARLIYGKEKIKYAGENMPVHMIDKHGNIVWVNKAWENLTGFKEENVIGVPVWVLLGKDQYASEKRVREKLSREIKVLRKIPVVFCKADESFVSVVIEDQQVLDDNQNIIGVITKLRSFTQIESSLQESLKKTARTPRSASAGQGSAAPVLKTQDIALAAIKSAA
jgi:PAS domain S-box-containing protein